MELGADGLVVVAEERDPRSSRVPTVCVALFGAVLSTDPRERLAPSSWGISNIGFVSRISSVSTGSWLSFSADAPLYAFLCGLPVPGAVLRVVLFAELSYPAPGFVALRINRIG